MGHLRRWGLGLVAALVVSASGCGEDPPSADQESAAPSASSSSDGASEPPTSSTPSKPDRDPALAMTCVGEGEPAVVLVSGLHTGSHTFDDLARELGATTRVCSYDRAGIGDSPPLRATAPDPSAGSAADDLARTLAAEGIPAPYVVVGWSYGGMVTQAFATRHADRVAGIVLEDSSVPDQFTDPYFGDIDWVEGGRSVDKAATIRQLRALDFGDVPLAVLTQGEASGEFGRLWSGYHKRLAGLSTDSVHVVAVQSGHEIHAEAQELELALIREVVEAVRSGNALPACDNRFDNLQGHCL